MSNYIIRPATINDVPFLAKTIIEAEKSGSSKIGLANTFNLTENELNNYLIQILDEEIDGCEFSISSFVIVEYNNEPVASLGGWIENENEDNQPSSILKSNLIGFVFPEEKLMELKKNSEVLKDIQFKRTPNVHQIEYGFVDVKHRGFGLTNKLITELLKIAKKENPDLKKSQVQVFENNTSIIRVFNKHGYVEIERRVSTHPSILEYFPSNIKLILEKKL